MPWRSSSMVFKVGMSFRAKFDGGGFIPSLFLPTPSEMASARSLNMSSWFDGRGSARVGSYIYSWELLAMTEPRGPRRLRACCNNLTENPGEDGPGRQGPHVSVRQRRRCVGGTRSEGTDGWGMDVGSFPYDGACLCSRGGRL